MNKIIKQYKKIQSIEEMLYSPKFKSYLHNAIAEQMANGAEIFWLVIKHKDCKHYPFSAWIYWQGGSQSCSRSPGFGAHRIRIDVPRMDVSAPYFNRRIQSAVNTLINRQIHGLEGLWPQRHCILDEQTYYQVCSFIPPDAPPVGIVEEETIIQGRYAYVDNVIPAGAQVYYVFNANPPMLNGLWVSCYEVRSRSRVMALHGERP